MLDSLVGEIIAMELLVASPRSGLDDLDLGARYRGGEIKSPETISRGLPLSSIQSLSALMKLRFGRTGPLHVWARRSLRAYVRKEALMSSTMFWRVARQAKAGAGPICGGQACRISSSGGLSLATRQNIVETLMPPFRNVGPQALRAQT